MGAVTVLALLLKNAGFVVSFNGAVMGSAIIYLFPSMMFLKKITCSSHFAQAVSERDPILRVALSGTAKPER